MCQNKPYTYAYQKKALDMHILFSRVSSTKYVYGQNKKIAKVFFHYTIVEKIRFLKIYDICLTANFGFFPAVASCYWGSVVAMFYEAW